MQVAIQGDNLESLNLSSDTSLLIASELCSRGCKIFWYHPSRLLYLEGEVYATGYYINVICNLVDEKPLSYEIYSDEVQVKLSEFSCIMIRQNPPVDMHYIASTHILSLVQDKYPQILFINNPKILRDDVEKILPITIGCPVPTTIISSSYDKVASFLSEQKKIVMKSIYGYGGADVIKISIGEEEKIREFLDQQSGIQVIAQKFMREIYEGDKRVIVCDGEVLGAVGRTPANDSFLTNSRMGGSVHKTVISHAQMELCQNIAHKLKERGIFLAGIDLIGDYVTEINITSPTLLVALVKYEGVDILKSLVDRICKI